MRPDLWVHHAAFERLDRDNWVSIVKIESEAGTQIVMFALPKFYDPREDRGRRAADLIRDYYMKEDA